MGSQPGHLQHKVAVSIAPPRRWTLPAGLWRVAGAFTGAALLLALPFGVAVAQENAWTTIGSLGEDRLRLGQLLGTLSTDGFLLRTPSSMTPAAPSSAGVPTVQWLYPEVRAVWNSAIAYSLNDGVMWAGRGASVLVRAGVRARYGPVQIVFAPEFTYSQNLPFEVLPGREPGRSTYSSPWHIGAESADLPLRFGDQSLRIVGPGQSSITVFAGPVAVGASTENQWWGPGIRNALVMSDNAQGIPHLFLRTTRPVQTPLGPVEARWIIGGLTESLYFDTVASNNLRSLSGLVVTLQPGGSRGLTLGIARTVYGEAGSAGVVLGRLFDVVTRFERLANPGEADSTNRRDQLISLFGRWVFPESHFEIYAEWARMELPHSLRDLLIAPQHTQGYTLGLQWARPVGGDDRFVRLQAELTDVEQSIAYTNQPTPPDYYTGRATVQGYTQRGKVIGAAIGPGGSSEWLAGDYIAPAWQAGLFLGRIRWEDNAMYRQPRATWLSHDVSLVVGARGAVRLARWDVCAEASIARRINYLFQNGVNILGGRTIDITNATLGFALSPR